MTPLMKQTPDNQRSQNIVCLNTQRQNQQAYLSKVLVTYNPQGLRRSKRLTL